MTIKELRFIEDVLKKIKNPDQFVDKALAFINKDLAIYNARKGQLRNITNYDY